MPIYSQECRGRCGYRISSGPEPELYQVWGWSKEETASMSDEEYYARIGEAEQRLEELRDEWLEEWLDQCAKFEYCSLCDPNIGH
jgi:hypothetical protein